VTAALLRIFGAGSLGREVRDAALDGGMKPGDIDVFDDAPARAPSYMRAMSGLVVPHGAYVCIAVANPTLRRAIWDRVAYNLGNFKSPRAYVAESAGLMDGHILLPGACLSSNCEAGHGLVVGFNSTIGHDVVLGEFVTISSQVDLCGGVTVGDGAFIGSGARVLPELTIGAGAYVGAGAVVVRSVAPGERVFGNPARVIGQTPGTT
jgi:sugar O-acyltransferase (sialic acid O-acetyltransferase NeuD family)